MPKKDLRIHAVSKTKGQILLKEFKRDWQLHLFMLLPVIWIIVFCYMPMYGVQIAFKDYSARAGIWGSKWVGLKWVSRFLNSYDFMNVFMNTLKLSIYDILVGFPLPIILALMLNSIQNDKLKNRLQIVYYIPHFLSLVVVISIFSSIFNPIMGVYKLAYQFFGGTGYPKDFRGLSASFRHIYVWTGVWQNVGWDSIIYVAALSSVSQDQHDAATVDGASRFQRILHVDLPTIVPTICIMLILRMGGILSVGFEKVLLLQNDLNLSVSDVISTYVYRVGMGSIKDFSFGAAVDLFNSILNCSMLLLVNFITRKMSNDEICLF